MTELQQRRTARPVAPIGRRAFISRVGRTAFGVLVVTTLPACAGADDAASADRPSVAASPGAPPSEVPSAAPVDWRRVDFDFVSAYILVRDGEAALVDTGVAGSEDTIEETLTELGIAWTDVGHVIVTHRHPDHVGGAVAVLERADGATAYAGPGDAEAIDTTSAVTVVDDGDSVFGLRIIATPGHTAGHISVLDEVGGLLIAGDALVGDGGTVAGPDPEFTDDLALAHESVRRLADLTFGTVVFGHGEPVSNGADAAVADLAERLSAGPSASTRPPVDAAPSAAGSPSA